jgi:hypothetical protein
MLLILSKFKVRLSLHEDVEVEAELETFMTSVRDLSFLVGVMPRPLCFGENDPLTS